jgi:hypothetical protein
MKRATRRAKAVQLRLKRLQEALQRKLRREQKRLDAS